MLIFSTLEAKQEQSEDVKQSFQVGLRHAEFIASISGASYFISFVSLGSVPQTEIDIFLVN